MSPSSSSSSSSSSLFILVVALCFISLISPSTSQTCSSSQNLTSPPFDTCLNLPSLNSYLHYTYNASNSSLSVAFVATPSQSTSWIAWGINPTMTGMNGSQAFVAYRSTLEAAPIVETYNISGYIPIKGKLAFEFWNLRTQSMSDGRIAIFTTVKIPAGMSQVNQVWQIGGNVINGAPGPHPLKPANYNSKSVLKFTSEAPSSAPPNGGLTSPGQARGPGNVGSLTTSVNFGVNFGIIVLLGSIFIF